MAQRGEHVHGAGRGAQPGLQPLDAGAIQLGHILSGHDKSEIGSCGGGGGEGGAGTTTATTTAYTSVSVISATSAHAPGPDRARAQVHFVLSRCAGAGGGGEERWLVDEFGLANPFLF